MSDSDQKHLEDQMDATFAHVAEWAENIEDGTYEDEDTEDGSIYNYPLEIVKRVGFPYTVVLCTGGPQIEVVAYGLNEARLEGYWWGSRATRYDYGSMPLTRFLDFFIERDD